MAQQGSPGGAPRVGRRDPFGLQGLRPLYLVRVLFVYDLSFVLHLALATPEHAQIRVVLCDSELHLE